MAKMSGPKSDGELLGGVPILAFSAAGEWERWLDRNHASPSGLWLKIGKTKSGIASVSYAEALEAALCYGWIDAQKRGYDESSWLQKFTPRKARSIWSKVNRQKAAELIAAGRMKPAGLEAVETAKKNGQWESAYDSPAAAAVPPDLEAELERRPEAKAFFAALSGTNRYSILHRLQTAKKPETRAKRLEKFVQMLENRETIYPQ